MERVPFLNDPTSVETPEGILTHNPPFIDGFEYRIQQLEKKIMRLESVHKHTPPRANKKGKKDEKDKKDKKR